MASVIIPAHNEARLIDRALQRLLRDSAPGELAVVVACNGCSDDTAGVARRPGVQVVEIDAASKVAALNAGDHAAGDVFPRVYLDADVELDPTALQAVIRSLAEGAPAAAPLPVVDTTRCGWVSRQYFAVWTRLGYGRTSFLGSGVYGMSEKGRARFGPFPDLIADDGFVYAAFTDDERVNPPGATFRVRAPRTARALFRRRIRIAAGNLELARALEHVPPPPGPSWIEVARADRRMLLPVVVYAVINTAARVAALRRVRHGTSGAWHTDLTVRGGVMREATEHGVRRAVRTLRSPRTWGRFVRVINFIGYDGGGDDTPQLGPGVRMSPMVSVRNGSRVRVGAGSQIGQGTCLWAGDSHGRVDIGTHALLAPNVYITASNYDFDAGGGPVMDLPKREADVRIGANTWLGANVVVVAGVTIGDGAIVAAGAVVTRDVPANSIVAGVPARVVRMRGERPS